MGPRQVLAMAAAMISVASVSAAQSSSNKVPLAPTQPGGLPDGFQVARTGKGAPAAWSVVADPGVQGGQVLVQTSTDQTDYRFPLAIYGGVAAANVEVTVRFKAVGGRIDRAGGIAVRLADPTTTTSCARMPWRTTSTSIVSCRARDARSMVSLPRSRPTSGIP